VTRAPLLSWPAGILLDRGQPRGWDGAHGARPSGCARVRRAREDLIGGAAEGRQAPAFEARPAMSADAQDVRGLAFAAPGCAG
jgi:hypothetical protein